MEKLALFLSFASLSLGGESIRPRPLEWAQPMLGMKLENIYKVSNDLYRSEQPDEDNLEEIKVLGIKSVLNLREYHDDEDELQTKGITLYRVAMNAGEVDMAKITQAIEIIKKAEKPILVHCWHGSDRTGAVVAAYRIVIQNWSNEAAIDEFKNGGYGYHAKWYPNIEVFLQNFKTKKQAF